MQQIVAHVPSSEWNSFATVSQTMLQAVENAALDALLKFSSPIDRLTYPSLREKYLRIEQIQKQEFTPIESTLPEGIEYRPTVKGWSGIGAEQYCKVDLTKFPPDIKVLETAFQQVIEMDDFTLFRNGTEIRVMDQSTNDIVHTDKMLSGTRIINLNENRFAYFDHQELLIICDLNRPPESVIIARVEGIPITCRKSSCFDGLLLMTDKRSYVIGLDVNTGEKLFKQTISKIRNLEVVNRNFWLYHTGNSRLYVQDCREGRTVLTVLGNTYLVEEDQYLVVQRFNRIFVYDLENQKVGEITRPKSFQGFKTMIGFQGHVLALYHIGLVLFNLEKGQIVYEKFGYNPRLLGEYKGVVAFQLTTFPALRENSKEKVVFFDLKAGKRVTQFIHTMRGETEFVQGKFIHTISDKPWKIDIYPYF